MELRGLLGKNLARREGDGTGNKGKRKGQASFVRGENFILGKEKPREGRTKRGGTEEINNQRGCR